MKRKSRSVERDPEVRFWLQVRSSREGCWEFRPEQKSGIYRQFNPGGGRKPIMAHRYSWELHNGPITPGLLVCHKCDNPKCVRPDHLFLGTPKENLEDASRKRRLCFGEKNNKARVSSDVVRQMFKERRQGATTAQIVKRFGLSRSQIFKILTGDQWAHLEEVPIVYPERVTEAMARKMFRLRARGMTYQQIGKMLKVWRDTVSRIVNGRTPKWKWLYEELRGQST